MIEPVPARLRVVTTVVWLLLLTRVLVSSVSSDVISSCPSSVLAFLPTGRVQTGVVANVAVSACPHRDCTWLRRTPPRWGEMPGRCRCRVGRRAAQPSRSSFFEEGSDVNCDDDEEEIISEEDASFLATWEMEEAPNLLPEGQPKGFYVTKHWSVQPEGFPDPAASGLFQEEDVARLGMHSGNMTLPSALMMLFPDEHPSLVDALRACRKGHVLLHRGPLSVDCDDGAGGENGVFDHDRCARGRVRDRVFPSDVVAMQAPMGGCMYDSDRSPPFDLPVVFEDDHVAFVNKPEGVAVYPHPTEDDETAGGNATTHTVRDALPSVLQPPRDGTVGAMPRPHAVHRLDKPTSGLLVVAKTKAAMADLSRQFAERTVQKTYIAIADGKPSEGEGTSLSPSDASRLGVAVDLDDGASGTGRSWQLIDRKLDGKPAVTVWRTLRRHKCPEANQSTLSLLELKPKTGRYHQLRRHMAKVHGCPLVGDDVYNFGEGARLFRKWGLFLCSTEVVVEHPYYNTDSGRKVWESLEDDKKKSKCGVTRLSVDGSNKVIVHAKIDLPNKFTEFLEGDKTVGF